MKTIVIIPALDPKDKMIILVKALLKLDFTEIIVVDDGSIGKEFKIRFRRAQELGCTVIHHEKNCGKGKAIKTAIKYSVEKYGVTIVQQDGTIISRFDSNTENIVRQYYSVDKNVLKKYEDKLSSNLTVTINKGKSSQLKIVPKVNLENIYKLQVDGNSSIKCGAPWYGNNKEIAKRINSQLCGKIYELNGQKFNINKDNLENKLSGKKIIEVVNNIDTSSYLKDEDSNKDTNLLTEYQMPTIEIIYIIQ